VISASPFLGLLIIVIHRTAHRWLRHRERIPKLPWPSRLVQDECLLSLLLCEKGHSRTDHRERDSAEKKAVTGLSAFPFGIGLRIIHRTACRWLRHRERIPKLPWPSGLVQDECPLSLLLSETGQRESAHRPFGLVSQSVGFYL